MADETTRRSFVQATAGAALTVGGIAAAGHQLVQISRRSSEEERSKNHLALSAAGDVREQKWAEIEIEVNGSVRGVRVPHERSLLLVLREDLGLTGTKKSCNLGHCGACTVLIDGLPMYSCLTLALDAAGRRVTTIEGLSKDGALHPLQQSFVDRMGSQCGHCTPGMIMSGVALLSANPQPTVEDVKGALAGNLCRCGNYPHEIAAVLAVAHGTASVCEAQVSKAAGPSIDSRAPMLDARAKATGEARYAGDLGFHADDPFQRPLVAKVVRCPYPHANVTGIDDTEARKLSGYRGIVTYRDIPGFLPAAGGPGGPRETQTGDRRPLNEKARYYGDAVAAVAADDVYTAHQALQLLRVDYEPLTAYPDAEANLRSGLTAIHSGPVAGFASPQAADKPTIEFSMDRTAEHLKIAGKVVEKRYVTPIQCHVPIEAHCCTAQWEGDSLTLWDSQQSVFHAREVIAKVLQVPPENVRVICQYLGGGFGGKCTDTPGKTLYQAIAALLARKTGRPVRLEYTLKELMFAEDVRNPFIFDLKTGARADGSIDEIDCRAVQRTGGYASSGPAVTSVAGEGIINSYRTRSYSYRGYSVYTNSPVGGEFRGFGHPQAVFAREVHMDEVAEALGIDPLEFRLRNCLRPGDKITLGVAKDIVLGNTGWEACMKLGAAAIGWDRWQPPSRKTARVRRGLGMRMSQEHSGRDASNGIVWRDGNGRYHVPVGSGNLGTESHTAVALIVAQALDVPVAHLEVSWGDSSGSAWDFVSDASRAVHCHGKAMYNAALDLKRQLSGARPRRTSEDLTPYCDEALDINPILDEATGQVEERPAARLHPGAQAFARKLMAAGGTVGLGYYGFNPSVQPWGASFAEVDVNMETGQVHVLKLVAVHDVGRIIHRLGAEAQIQGGAIMSYGYAMSEELPTDPHTGIPVYQSLYDYRPPTILDPPELVPILVEAPAPAGPFGAKGLGENPMFDAPAAISNAIFNAAGVRIREIPCTWYRVYDELKRAGRLMR